MELKDFIHYYLGCEVETDMSSSNMGRKRGILIGIAVRGEITFYDILYGKTNHQSHHAYPIKPILRPLSDMTEEDVSVFCNLDDTTSLKSFKVDQQLIEICYIANGESYQSYYHYYFNALSPRQFHYLISKGFNLFDPEWKYCIDKTKNPTT